jgi:hypothetical protein
MKNLKNTILKTTFFLCLFFAAQLTNAQISVSAKNKKISQILEIIEKKSGYSFFYNTDLQEVNKYTSIEVSNATIEASLDKLFENTSIAYKIKDKQVVLTDKTRNSKPLTRGVKKVTGTVTDSKGEPIIGATILDKESKTGTISDINGKFSINVADPTTLKVSYVGYATRDVKTSGKDALYIILNEDTKALDEVVVIGYGTAKKGDLTGSVASINEKQLTEKIFVSPEQALQGLVAGVQVIDVNAEPGGESSIRIRGSNSINSETSRYLWWTGLLVDRLTESIRVTFNRWRC